MMRDDHLGSDKEASDGPSWSYLDHTLSISVSERVADITLRNAID